MSTSRASRLSRIKIDQGVQTNEPVSEDDEMLPEIGEEEGGIRTPLTIKSLQRSNNNNDS